MSKKVKTEPVRSGSSAADKWVRNSTTVFNRHLVFLDRQTAEIRAKTTASISRAEIIRALIDALEDSGMDISGVRSEEELRALLEKRLKRRPH